jgi:hypothetical protein
MKERKSLRAPKLLVCLLLASMMLMMLAGCGSNKADGKYTLYKMVMDGKEYTVSELSEQYGMDVSSLFQFDIEINGSKAIGDLYGEHYEGTAKLSGSTLTITFNDDSLDCPFDANEGTITMEMDGEKIILKRQ